MLPSSSTRATAGITSNPRIFPPPSSSEADIGAGSNETTTSSSMRPRNRRLISTEQELVSTAKSNTSSPSGSRAVSPIPSKHPSRSSVAARGKGNGRPVGGLLALESGGKGGAGQASPVGFGGIWEGGWTSSWSALQGLASSVLGVDTEGESSVGDGGSVGKKAQRRQGVGRQLPEAWGPEGLPKKNDPGIGMGSTADRDSVLRTRKMAGVLEGRSVDNTTLDTNGIYKKRSSLEESRQDTQRDDEGDALVYVHHVRPQDTLAGVVLRYNCQPAVFRKANRFWPNDSIQIRKVVVLPVDACTIKGRPCEPPSSDSQGVDLLAPTPGIEDTPPFTNGGTRPRASSSRNETSAERPKTEEEHPWTHVRWVLVDSSPSSTPVEIARMPRKTLGYFPPRRRKSQTTLSTVSTPRGSIDFQASHDQTGSPASSSSRRTSNLGPRPSQPIGGSYFPPQSSGTRSRRESVGEAAERLGWMRGPGGVGTLGKNVRKPGPSNDGLNTWAKKHIPGLAIDSLPSTSILGGESAHFGFGDELTSIAEGQGPVNGLRSNGMRSGTVTPSGLGQGIGLENAAAAIEGWVRRLAVKPGTPKLGGRSHIENADLIELLDGAGSDDGRGFELNPGSLRAATPGVGGSGREDLDGLIRGKATAGAKGGKSD